MKKLLSLLAVCSFGAVASSSVVACTQKPSEDKNIEGFNEVESKIIRDVVSENKVDYKFIDKELTYEEFFNKDGNHHNYIMDKLYTEYTNKLNETDMNDEEKTDSFEKFFVWSQKNVNLVYLNKDKELKITYQGDEENLVDKKLENIYLDAHKEFSDEKDIEFFTDTLALRIGNLDNWTFTFGEKEISWGLNGYNNKPNDQPNRIWISKETVKPLLEKEDKTELFKFIKEQLWQGMFDADDKPDKNGNVDHSRQMKRFEEQNINKVFQLTENADELVSALEENIKEDSNYFIFKDLGLELTKDVFSKTTDIKTGGVKDYILKKSEATIEKIEINLI